MKKLVNPFKPTAGAEPPVLVGRDKVIEDFSDGLAEGVGARGRLMRITGPRGSGKTVLLTELGDVARSEGWEVVDETARKGFSARIARTIANGNSSSDVSFDLHLGIADFHASTHESGEGIDLRRILTVRARELTKQHRGLLITLDEVQDADRDEMRELAAAIQHLIRERYNIAFVFAGLTAGVLDLIDGEALTFLRRALPEELDSIPLEEVRDALEETVTKSGLNADKVALERAANATVGYAYLIQLVGYHVWRSGRKHVEESSTITVDDAAIGIERAMGEFYDVVHESAVSGLPLRAMEYLIAMAEEPAIASTAAIAERMGVDASALTSCRRLLIQKQIIESNVRGCVEFSIPYTREFLLANREKLLARYGEVAE